MAAVPPLWAFLAVTIPLVLTPGASTTVVLRNSLAGGMRAGVETAIGANLGSICYGLLTAFGFALILDRLPSAWTVLRAGGLAYLVWLGVHSLRAAFAPEVPRRAAASSGAAGRSAMRLQYARDGFLTNVLNPALATFYLVLLPQFIPRGAPVARSALILTLVHVTLAASWHLTWAAAGGTLSRTVDSPRAHRILDATAGVGLLALAGFMAWTATAD